MGNLRLNKNSKSEKTYERILKEAIRLFLEKGFHGCTIGEITKAAGITQGAFYWHYKSKEHLLKRILEEYENKFLNEMIQATQEVDAEPIAKFEGMLRYAAKFAAYNRELCVSFTTLAAELIGSQHRIESKIRKIYEKYHSFLSSIILEGKKKKIFKKNIDHDLAGLALIAFFEGILLQWSMKRDKIDGEAFVKTFKEIIINGLKA